MRQRGITIVEITIASALFLVLVGTAAVSVVQDTRAERVLTAQLGPQMRVSHAMERLTSELRMAGVHGEDRNANGELDDGEDMNANGRLDADWTLADGALDQPELVFNRRLDLVEEESGQTFKGAFSGPIGYRLDGENLVRSWSRTDPATGEQVVVSQVLARGITGLRFSRQGSVIRIAMEYRLPPRAYKTDRRTHAATVWLRN